jgi:DNA-binding MarR family transcriptional regulator
MHKTTPADKPLSALLSQILVAYTVELDNKFEQQMNKAGYAGARLSLTIWLNLIRFIPTDGISVRELASQALAPQERIKFQLGCLERWGIVALESEAGATRSPTGDGWGSGRRLNAKWTVRLTEEGVKAAQIWPPLFVEIERRWRKRFGSDDLEELQKSLRAVESQIELELPQDLADMRDVKDPFPSRTSRDTDTLSLPALLSRLLTLFAVEFEPQSRAALADCANLLRVLGENPVPLSDIPQLTGGSPEMTDVGWRVKPFVIVEASKGARRGKSLRLSPLGVAAQQNYYRLVDEIEKGWEKRYGKEEIRDLRQALVALLNAEYKDHPLLAEGLIAPEGTVRAGDTAPALGRRDVGSAAKQRARDLVAQTEAFVSDPANALPHFPLLDMNRGFGP